MANNPFTEDKEKLKEDIEAILRKEAGMQRPSPPGKLTTPLRPRPTEGEFDAEIPAVLPDAEKEALYEGATKTEKKKIDKARFRRERDEKSLAKFNAKVQTNRKKAILSQDAEAKIWEETAKKYPPPSKLATLFGMATMGFGELLLGSPAKRRKYGEAGSQAVKRYRELQKDDVVTSAAKRARATGAGKAAAGVARTDGGNISKVYSLIADLEASGSLPSNWATFQGGLGPSDSGYRQQLTNLNMGLIPTKIKGKVIPANPQASIIVEALKNRLEQYKTIRTANRERWKKDGAAAMLLDGTFPPAFIARMQRESPEAMIYAKQGTLESKAVPAGKAYEAYQKNREDASETAVTIFKLLGEPSEQAVIAKNAFLETLMDKQRWTSDPGMKFLRDARKELARWRRNTGTYYTRDAANEKKLLVLELQREKILDELNVKELGNARRAELERDWEVNSRDRVKLSLDMYLIDPEEVKAANEEWATARGERVAERNLLSNRAAADIDKSRESIGDELWEKNGGDEAFLETVILDKDGKVVLFDKKKHKDQKDFVFRRIKLGKRQDALATRSEEIVTAWDDSGKPLTSMRKVVSGLEEEEIGQRAMQMLTVRDVEEIKRASENALDLDYGVDVDVVGRLQGDARQKVLAWMGTPRGQKVLNASGYNFKLFRRGFMPEEVDLTTLGGKGGFDAGLEIWKDVEDLAGLKRILNNIEGESNKWEGKISNWANRIDGEGGYEGFYEAARKDKRIMDAIRRELNDQETLALIDIRDKELEPEEKDRLLKAKFIEIFKRFALIQRR